MVFDQYTSTILITEALPIRCRATTQSPLAQYRIAFACSIEACSTEGQLSCRYQVSLGYARLKPAMLKLFTGGTHLQNFVCSV